MSKQSPSFFNSLANFIRSIFGGTGSTTPQTPQTPRPSVPTTPVITAEPLVPLTPRVLVIVYDPVIDPLKNTRLVEWGIKNKNWARVGAGTNDVGIDAMIATYIKDVDECSGGLVKYNVVERINVDGFPLKLSGKRFTALEYIDLYTVNQSKYKEPDDRFDYNDFIKEFNLLQRVNNNEIDEVWVFAYPFSGNYESVMCGTGAFWTNGPVIENTPGKRFVIMGFSYERGVGEMEEDLGHRMESMVSRMYGAEDFLAWTYSFKNDPTKFDALKYAETNLFGKFLLHDKIAPGNSQCGNVHYAPNSDKDYDWSNPRPVVTYADDWLTFPNMPKIQKMMNANAWGSGDIRGHHRWWFARFPKVEGRMNGIRMNWWSYICDAANPEFDKVSGKGGPFF